MRKHLYLFLFSLLPSFAFAQSNFALHLNGTNQFVSIGAPIATGSSYTKEAWVYLSSTVGAHNFISSLNAPLWALNGILRGGHDGQYEIVIDGSPLPLHTWTHVALTYNASTGRLTLYRNGVQVGAANAIPAYTQESTFIGSHQGTASFMNGKVDEVRIWNTELSAAQIKQNMLKGPATDASGLVAYYSCNNGSGSVLTNICTNGTGTNGSITGATWEISPVQFATNALNFDGTNDFVGIARPLTAGSSYTKEAWVYLANNATPRNIISSSQSPFWVFENRLRAGNNGPLQDIMDATDFPLNTWVHVAVTYSASTGAMQLYRNGVLVASGTSSQGYINEDNYIGAYYLNGTTESYWAGHIDELRIWNTVRSQSQIQANMQRELNPADAVETSGLTAYYNFNQGVAGGNNTGIVTLLDQKGSFDGVLTNFGLSGNASNFVEQQNTLTVLPVKWLSFVAKQKGENALLQWQVTTESNAGTFSVEYSVNGRTWRNIGNVPFNTSNREATYQFTHTGLQQGQHFYRIGLQEKDGKISYSDSRIVKIFSVTPAFQLFSNSVSTSLKVDVLRSCLLSMYDLNGRLVLQQSVKQGFQSLDVSSLSKGIYIMSDGTNSERIEVK